MHNALGPLAVPRLFVNDEAKAHFIVARIRGELQGPFGGHRWQTTGKRSAHGNWRCAALTADPFRHISI